MTLDTLRRTREENDPAGNPVRGIYHYMVIQRILDICEKYKLNHEIEEILLHKTKQKSTGCCDRPRTLKLFTVLVRQKLIHSGGFTHNPD